MSNSNKPDAIAVGLVEDMPCGKVVPYSRDVALLMELGLPLWSGTSHEEILVGDVFPFPESEGRGRHTKITVYVSCYPAQFYRFVILRPSEDEGYDGMEQLEVRTGNGLLKNYWPIAMAVANNVVSVGPAIHVRTETNAPRAA